MSGSAVKSRDWPNNEKSITCKTDNFAPLVVPGLSANSGSSSFSAPQSQDSLREDAHLVSGNRAASSSSAGSVSERSVELATKRLGKGAGVPEKWQEGRERSVSRSSILVRRFHRQSGAHRSACTRTQFSGIRLGTSCRSGDKIEKAHYLYSLPERSKLRRLLENQQGLLAEDALAKLCLEQKSLVTW